MPTNDPRRSAKFELIELHYDDLGDRLHWTNARYRRLCSAMQLTVYELGAIIRCRISDVDRWTLSNRYPSTVELHLTMIESTVFPSSGPDLFPPL